MKRNVFKIINFVLLIVLGFVFASAIKTNAYVTSGVAYFMSTQPGEDASTEAGISYHSTSENTYVMLTEITDTDYSNAVKHVADSTLIDYLSVPAVDGTLIKLEQFPEVSYDCDVDLVGLKPNTKYKYYVSDGVNKSKEMQFITAAGGNATFTFAYVNDTQHYSDVRYTEMGVMYQNILETINKTGRELAFLYGGGDMVENGGKAHYWSMNFEHSIFEKAAYLSFVGNHEFTGSSSSQTVDGRFYASMHNNPENGATGAYPETSYYNLYNDTLIVSLSMAGGAKQAQIAWMEEVFRNNPAKWIIAGVHYPPNTTGTDNVREFVPIFDKYGVDLVLYGHEHNFVTQTNYYNYKAAGSNNPGTTYQQMASGEAARYKADTANYSLITVTEDNIVVNCYNYMNAPVRSYSLSAKRPNTKDLPEFNNEEFEQSINIEQIAADRSKAYVSWSDSGYMNVHKLEVLDSNNAVLGSNVLSTTKFANFTLTGLTLDTDYNFKIRLTYMDLTTKEIDYEYTTRIDSYAKFADLEFDTADGLKVSFTPTYHPDVVEANVFVNGEQNQKLLLTRKSFSIDSSDLGETALVEIIGKLKDGTTTVLLSYEYSNITVYTISYDLDGGVNGSDPVVEFTDASTVTLPTPTKEGYLFDGWYEGNSKITTITEKDYQLKAKWIKIYTVSYDLDGGTVTETLVTEFTVASQITLPTPTKEGFTFKGWYEGETKVTKITLKDYQLKAVYEEIEEPIDEPIDEPEPATGCQKAIASLFTLLSVIGFLVIKRRKF